MEDKLVAQKTHGKKTSTTDSINQVGNQNNSIKRTKSHWLCDSPVHWSLKTQNSIYRQSIHDRINPTLKASNHFPLLTFLSIKGSSSREWTTNVKIKLQTVQQTGKTNLFESEGFLCLPNRRHLEHCSCGKCEIARFHKLKCRWGSV